MNNGPAGEVDHRRGAILDAHSAAWASALGRNAAAGLRPERVRRDELRLYAGNFPLLRHLRLGQEKKNGFFLLLPEACTTLAPPNLGCASGKRRKTDFFFSFLSACTTLAPPNLACASGKRRKTDFFFSFLSACTNFGSAQLRLRLGQEKKNGFFLLFPLGLH